MCRCCSQLLSASCVMLMQCRPLPSNPIQVCVNLSLPLRNVVVVENVKSSSKTGANLLRRLRPPVRPSSASSSSSPLTLLLRGSSHRRNLKLKTKGHRSRSVRYSDGNSGVSSSVSRSDVTRSFRVWYYNADDSEFAQQVAMDITQPRVRITQILSRYHSGFLLRSVKLRST